MQLNGVKYIKSCTAIITVNWQTFSTSPKGKTENPFEVISYAIISISFNQRQQLIYSASPQDLNIVGILHTWNHKTHVTL